MTVAEFLARVDSDELTEWIAFVERIRDPALDPAWQQTAQLCTVIEQNWSKKPRRFEEFLPRSTRKKVEPITPQALQARLAAFRSAPGRPTRARV